MSTPTETLADQGVSIWLDDLSRERITSGNLAELIRTRHISGVTTNPTIFAAALAQGDAYDEQVAALRDEGADVDEAIFAITSQDVRDAADIFRPVYDVTGGVDGRVSIEVSPDLAHDAAGTIAQAKDLWERVGRDNALIKIPATIEGLEAITAVIAEGISVNVTLIFSLERYRAVIDAYLTGLEQAHEKGLDLSRIESVASFFVSRVDTEIDKRLDASGADADLKSLAGIANARLAYEVFLHAFEAERAQVLRNAGANLQRPLWASTGVKDPSLPDTLYVTELVALGTVNTMPEKTLEATYDHAEIAGDTITPNLDAARESIARLADAGIDLDDVTEQLEKEGVEKFLVSWRELQQTVADALEGKIA